MKLFNEMEFCQIKGNSLHFLNILIVYVQESSDRDGEKILYSLSDHFKSGV